MRPGPPRGSTRRPPASAWPCTDREERSRPCPARRAGVRSAASPPAPAAAAEQDCDPTHRLHRGPAGPRFQDRCGLARRALAHRPARDRANAARRAQRCRADAVARREDVRRRTSRDRPCGTGLGPERPRNGYGRVGRAVRLAPGRTGAAEREALRRQFAGRPSACPGAQTCDRQGRGRQIPEFRHGDAIPDQG